LPFHPAFAFFWIDSGAMDGFGNIHTFSDIAENSIAVLPHRIVAIGLGI